MKKYHGLLGAFSILVFFYLLFTAGFSKQLTKKCEKLYPKSPVKYCKCAREMSLPPWHVFYQCPDELPE